MELHSRNKKLKMQNTETHKNDSPEHQLLALKDANTRQNLEIRGLKCKISILEKSIRLMEEKLSKLENELKKHNSEISRSRGVAITEKKCSSTQTEKEQKADKGLQNEAKPFSHLTHISAFRPAPFSVLKFGSAPPRNAIRVPAVLPSKQESSEPGHKYPISGNTTINISSRAFTETNPTAKRTGSDMPPLSNAKRPRLDASSPDAKNTAHKTQSLISSALETVQKSCCDVLPTDTIDALLKGTSELPALRDEEKAVISEFCGNKALAKTFLSVILDKIKKEREFMGPDLLQSLCRVYVGLCQQRGDFHKAHALAYRLLKDDFPDAPKLIMVMVTAWPSVFSHDGSSCRAIHIVSKLKARGNILDLLSKYLHWDEEPPESIFTTINSTLKALHEDSSLTFQKNSWYGEDLCPAAWDYIYQLELLCAHLGWTWTFTNIIRNDLWLTLDTWVLQARTEQTPFRDVSVAAVFRLLGRLGQIGLKENLAVSVQNLVKGIHEFGNRKLLKDMPWEVQLSMVYATHDLAPSNPKVALKTIESWRQKIRQPVPPAAIQSFKQINFLCHQSN